MTLREYDQYLEEITEEWNHFIQDCHTVIELKGFSILVSYASRRYQFCYWFLLGDETSEKIHCVRISDFDMSILVSYMEVKQFLQMNNFSENFIHKCKLCKVIVGSVQDDTWNNVFGRLQDILDDIQADDVTGVDLKLPDDAIDDFD